MKPYAEVLQEFEMYYYGLENPNKDSLKRLYDVVRDGLPNMTLQAVKRARGTNIDTYIRGRIGDHKFEYKHCTQEEIFPIRVAACAVEAVGGEMGITGFKFISEFIAEAMLEQFEPILSKALAEPKNLRRAQARVKKNKKLAEDANHKKAMERLRQTLASWPYTRQEVLSAWNLQQVRQVMES